MNTYTGAKFFSGLKLVIQSTKFRPDFGLELLNFGKLFSIRFAGRYSGVLEIEHDLDSARRVFES